MCDRSKSADTRRQYMARALPPEQLSLKLLPLGRQLITLEGKPQLDALAGVGPVLLDVLHHAHAEGFQICLVQMDGHALQQTVLLIVSHNHQIVLKPLAQSCQTLHPVCTRSAEQLEIAGNTTPGVLLTQGVLAQIQNRIRLATENFAKGNENFIKGLSLHCNLQCK